MPIRGKPSLDYLAGLFDGEGSIFIIRYPKFPGCPDMAYRIGVGLAMTDQRAVSRFQARWPGSYVHAISRPKMPHSKPIYMWRLTSTKAERFLEDIYPHLDLKAPQAALALEFQGLLSRGKDISEDNLDQRIRIWRKMRSLNGQNRSAPAETKRESTVLLETDGEVMAQP
jgi:hypothetical protein